MAPDTLRLLASALFAVSVSVGPAWATDAASTAGTMADAPHPLATQYARYLTTGRSEVEVHLREAGDHATARITAQADGSFRCEVGGLRGAAPEVLIHETMHCQTAPWLGALRAAIDTPPATDALVLLTAECISDARAVIEVFRRDGSTAAQQLVRDLRPRREASDRSGNSGHATMLALDAALQAAPALVDDGDDSAAFAAALRIGSTAAQRQFERGGGRVDANVHAAIASALQSAEHAFRQGRYGNTAFTVHAADNSRHYFVAADGSLRHQPALGGEGAQGLAALQQLLTDLQQPADRLAAQWLQRQGRLDAAQLQRTSRVFAQFLRSLNGGQGAIDARLARQLSALIDASPRGLDLGGLLDEAADQLREFRVAG